MSTSFIIYIFLLVYVAFLLYKSIHIVGETERLAVVTLGRFDGTVGLV